MTKTVREGLLESFECGFNEGVAQMLFMLEEVLKNDSSCTLEEIIDSREDILTNMKRVGEAVRRVENDND